MDAPKLNGDELGFFSEAFEVSCLKRSRNAITAASALSQPSTAGSDTRIRWRKSRVADMAQFCVHEWYETLEELVVVAKRPNH